MRNPLVSVIVPTKNSAEFLDACLKSIQAQSYKNIELIVVDNKSTDDTQKIAAKYTSKIFTYGPERSAQRNYGAKKSRGQYLLIIDSDMELTKDVVKACVEKSHNNEQIKAVVVPEESFGEGFWAQCKKLERSFYVGVEWMEAARFFHREIFELLAGYDEKNTGMEDYDLPQRIKYKYGKNSVVRVRYFIFHNERQISLLSTCKKKYYYVKNSASYKNKIENKQNYSKQASIFKRYKLFFSHPKKLLSHPFTGAGLLFMKTAEFGAGGFGLFYKILTSRNEKE